VTAPPRLTWWQWLLLAAGLLIFAVQAGWSSTHKSAAFDEQYHLAAGYAYLRTGDFRLATNHPPLAGWLASLPLLGDATITLPTDHPSWQSGDRFLFSDIFLWESNNNAQSLLLRARAAMTLLGVALAASIFFAARQMLGVKAGWLALLLAIFEPNLIAHSRFVTTDLPLTLFTFLAVWWWWRWLVQARWRNMLLAGLFAGLAMGTKYNGALIWAIIGLATLLQPITPAGATWRQRLAALAGAALAAVAVVWALYRFTVGPVDFLPGSLPLPAPHYWQWFWNTVVRIIDLQGARVDFFMGEASNRYWWHYFFVAAGVKLPLPVLLLSLTGFVLLVRDRSLRRLSVLWLPPTLLLLLGTTQVLNIGFRHMLPALPFLLLLGANVAERLPWFAARPRRAAIAAALLVTWLIFDVVRIAPHYESFFNQLAGPWQNWSNLLVDSNLDWGQDLIELRRAMETRGIDTVNLAYFGKAAPEAYGVRYQPLPSYLRFMEGREIAAYNPFTPEPGWYAISATALRTGIMTPETVDLYKVFRGLEPDARAGYSIYLYNLTYPPETAVVRPTVLDTPLWMLTPGALEITPGQRGQVKWLAAPDATIFPQGEGFTAADDAAFQAVSADFGDVLTFLGYTKDAGPVQAGAPLTLTLFWQVGHTPMPQPAPTRGAAISTFVHLVDGDPAHKVAEVDGWPTALRGLEPGDVIAQRVTLQIPENTPPAQYNLLVGVYSPQNWQRLTTTQEGMARDYADAGAVEVTP
jgi:4-amino-4-deoxy-L-arabinose transferase-like glycosyltransferase